MIIAVNRADFGKLRAELTDGGWNQGHEQKHVSSAYKETFFFSYFNTFNGDIDLNGSRKYFYTNHK